MGLLFWDLDIAGKISRIGRLKFGDKTVNDLLTRVTND